MTPAPAIDPQAAAPDVADDQQQPNYGQNFRDLPDELKKAILAKVREAQQQEKYVRRQEVLQDAEHRFYDMGIQHIYRGSNSSYVQAQPGGSYNTPDGEEFFGTYIGDYDIFHPFAQIQSAKLTENLPGIDFQPTDPNNPDDVEASNAAEGMRRDFNRNNDIKDIQKSIIYNMQMGGRVVTWTYLDDEAEAFGVNRAGGPRRGCRVSVGGCLEWKVPIYAAEQKDFWYAIGYDDPDIKIARTKYSWIRDKIAAGQTCLSEEQYERTLRLGALQGSQGGRPGFRIGDSISHLVSRAHVWLRLAAFEDCMAAYDGETTVRDAIAQLYPDGVHVCIVGNEYAESWNQSMDDCLSVGHAYIGRGQSRMPVMKPMVVVQDRFNSFMNYTAENFDYGAPSVWVNANDQDYAAITKQKAQPWAFRQMKNLPQGMTVSDMLARETPPELPQSFEKYGEFLYAALPQFMLFVPPSIWGEAMKDQKTASGYQLAAVQAMGILSVFWEVMTARFSDIYYQNCIAIRDQDKFPAQITVSQDGRNLVVRKDSLSKGNFRAFPDTDSGFPETTAAKRATLERVTTMLSASPLAAQIYGNPDNVAYMLREEGLPDLVIPEALSREKQLREIETLLNQAPITDQMISAMLNSQPPADIPTIMRAIKAEIAMEMAQAQQAMVQHAAQSIVAQQSGQTEPRAPQPPDPADVARSSVTPWDSDYHVWEAKKCRDWLSSEECNRELTQGQPDSDGEPKPNIAGILNVILHMQEHDALAAQQAAPISGPLPAPGMAPAVTGAPPMPPAAPAAPSVM